jgi:hypothetical protein
MVHWGGVEADLLFSTLLVEHVVKKAKTVECDDLSHIVDAEGGGFGRIPLSTMKLETVSPSYLVVVGECHHHLLLSSSVKRKHVFLGIPISQSIDASVKIG